MTDKYRIDNHKLMFHPERVAKWQEGKDNWETAKKIYPLYVEVSPVGFCNHRCTFCALDFMEYQHRQLDPVILKDRLTEMAKLGVKSVMFAGEGEPTLYKEMPEIIEHCTKVGIDTSLTTNMVPFTEKNSEIFVKNCKWIKVSMNAGTPENYAEIHRTKASDFDLVVKNLERCVKLKKDNSYKCTIGSQILMVSDNAHTVKDLAKVSRDVGLDYLVIKPYSQHMSSITCKYKDTDYSDFLYLEEELKNFNTDTFKVVFRRNTMDKLINQPERYQRCNATPYFWGYIQSDGQVFGCSCFLENEKFAYGDIHEKTFQEIWEGDKRKANYTYIREELDIQQCRENCRMDEVNRYLWELSNPTHHVNFI